MNTVTIIKDFLRFWAHVDSNQKHFDLFTSVLLLPNLNGERNYRWVGERVSSICIVVLLKRKIYWPYLIVISCTAWKLSVFGDFLVCIFQNLDWIRRYTPYLSIFSPNAGKYGPEKLQIRILNYLLGVVLVF